MDDQLTDEELDIMIEEIDSDGSGTVDFDGKKKYNKLINIFKLLLNLFNLINHTYWFETILIVIDIIKVLLIITISIVDKRIHKNIVNNQLNSSETFVVILKKLHMLSIECFFSNIHWLRSLFTYTCIHTYTYILKYIHYWIEIIVLNNISLNIPLFIYLLKKLKF